MRLFLIALTFALTGCGSIGLDVMDTGGMDSILGVDPAGQIDFGQHHASAEKAARKDIVLWVDGGRPLAIVDVYLDETSDSSFWMSSDLPLPIRLSPDMEFPVEVRFNPSGTGTHRAELVILLDDGTTEGAYVRRPIVGEGCDGDC
jgi:hypothetical protein